MPTLRTNFYSLVINWLRLMFASSRHRRNLVKSKSLINLLQKVRKESGDGAVISYLRKIDPYVYEEMILTAFERRGLLVKRGLQYSGDGGVDGMVKYRGEWYLIQAKRYQSHINPKHVKDFDAHLEKAGRKGFFVHTGKTGSGSRESLSQGRSKIVSGSRMVDLLLSEESFG